METKTTKLKITTMLVLLVTTIMVAPMISQNSFAQNNNNGIGNQSNTNFNNQSPSSDNLEDDEIAEQQNLTSQAKISAQEAQQFAVKNVSATDKDVKLVELDNENGKIVYSVEILKNNQTLDVKVDALNGNVLSNQPDFEEQGEGGEGEEDNEEGEGEEMNIQNNSNMTR